MHQRILKQPFCSPPRGFSELESCESCLRDDERSDESWHSASLWRYETFGKWLLSMAGVAVHVINNGCPSMSRRDMQSVVDAPCALCDSDRRGDAYGANIGDDVVEKRTAHLNVSSASLMWFFCVFSAPENLDVTVWCLH